MPWFELERLAQVEAQVAEAEADQVTPPHSAAAQREEEMQALVDKHGKNAVRQVIESLDPNGDYGRLDVSDVRFRLTQMLGRVTDDVRLRCIG